ncbi:hypothetical protein ACJMK2_007682 [Sinanodonta woodiana]|uniref:ADAMTS cysteine-rich domain-containing protein n=1 Tax=Sinanodonta woodiana TaxID=1069815 RepID=A0ABD3VJM3_SINWO
MSSQTPTFHPGQKYSINPWMFSQCSVEAFKRTLVGKTCVTTKQIHDQELLSEFHKVMTQEPGVRFPPDVQCVIINGFGSRYCGGKPEHICMFMMCTDPETEECEDKYYSAATGTRCGSNKHCEKGLCVPTHSVG